MTTICFKGFIGLIISSTIALSAWAADDLGDGKTIEVNYSAEKMLPYKQRREDWSIVAGFNVEQLFPDGYKSAIDQFSYEELFGSSTLNITQGYVGAKYNMSFGSMGIGGMFGYGSLNDGRISGTVNRDVDATLEVTKYGGYANLTLDTLFNEPYVAPYVEGQIYSMEWTESSKSGEEAAGWADIATAFRVGALIQLNWLDPDSALQARESSGLNNTFLDVFVSFYSASERKDDLSFESTANYGAGLSFEY